MNFADALTLDRAARICADGSLVAEVFAARTGLQDYLGREVDPQNAQGLRDKATVKVYRPESEVFKADSLATFAAAPVTVDHPTNPVTADNWRGLGVGEINGDVVRDGERVRVPIIIRDAAAVKAAQTTHKQLSMGYATELVFPADGKHPDGTVCDAYQTNLRINHIALVRAARGGPELRVVDERPQPKEPAVAGTIIVDGLPVSLADEAAVRAVIEKKDAAIAAAQQALADMKSKADKEMGEKDAEIDDMKKKMVDQAQIDALADAKAEVVAKARAVVGDKLADTKGKTVAEVRRMALDAASIDVADKSDDYVEARFDALTADAKAPAKVHNIAPAATTIGDSKGVIDALRLARTAA
jgi:uncharacterized protein